jgi:hypothetical protein
MMNTLSYRVFAGFFALLLPVVAQADPPNLVFSGGAVSIDADAVSLRAILDEWARLGGTGLEGIEQLSDVVITLHVAAIAESDALDALLRGRHGYAAVPRKPGEAGASRFARIVVFSPITPPATDDGTPQRRVVPADWPFPVNEHAIDADAHAPRIPSATVEEIPGINTPWPFPVNVNPDTDTPAPDAPSAVPGVPGIDVPWPFPVNVNPDTDAPAPDAPPAVPGVPGIDVPWPFPVNVDPDTDAPSIAPATAGPPAAGAAVPRPTFTTGR